MLDPERFANLLSLYETLDVKRWHREKIPAQTTCDHSGKMVLLCAALHPNPSINLLKAIILHDAEEYLTGDFPSEIKEQIPELQKLEKQARADFFMMFEMDNPFERLTKDDWLWLKYLDKLEVLLYIEMNIGSSHVHAADIFERQLSGVVELENQLKARGFFTEPDHKNLQ